MAAERAAEMNGYSEPLAAEEKRRFGHGDELRSFEDWLLKQEFRKKKFEVFEVRVQVSKGFKEVWKYWQVFYLATGFKTEP